LKINKRREQGKKYQYNYLKNSHMGTAKRFEELEVWQQARRIYSDIFRLTNRTGFSTDYSLVNQMRRSSGSIMDNIAEGFERGGNKEFLFFLSMAKGSAGELKSQLYRGLDQGKIKQEEFDDIANKIDHTSNLIGKFISYLKSSGVKRTRYKVEESDDNGY